MVYALVAFLGAFLLFSAEPLIGKILTPALGGGAQVWITCMFFYQACLLGGYTYAHLLITHTRPVAQRRIHAGLLFLATLVLLLQGFLNRFPLNPDVSSLLANTGPWGLLKCLTAQLALPMITLSATSPLLLAWFAKVKPGENPYRLYAASNLGSLGGLLCYPFLTERFLPLPTQGWVFLALFLGLLVLPKLAPRRGEIPESSPSNSRSSGKEIAQWVLASAGGSMILMAGSTYLSSEVAAIPLLWVLPLALYLLTFILVFETGIARYERTLLAVAGTLLAAFFALLVKPKGVQVPWQVIASCLGTVFSGALLCHGCLFAVRPPSERLTAYFLAIAAGGVVGGLFVAILAPQIYDRVYELPGSVALAGGIGLFWALKSRLLKKAYFIWFPVASLVVGIVGSVSLFLRPGKHYRDFYGTVRVVQTGRILAMTHGQTVHGAIRLDAPYEPLTYFHPRSAVGQTMLLLGEGNPSLNIGIVGLGVGTLADYGRAGDRIVFYEISPAVLELSGLQGRMFPLLRACPAQVEVVPGDARISLGQERKNGRLRQFDLLVIDAFSSDAVPWHLLTIEALQLYFDHLKPEGILALHISTPLPLDRVVCTGARALDLYGLLKPTPGMRHPDPEIQSYLVPSYYALLSRQRTFLNDPSMRADAIAGFGPKTYRGQTEAAKAVPYLRRGLPWTDARSSLSDLLFERRAIDPK